MRSNRSPQKQIIGVDVGGTKIAACVVDPQGTILSTIRRSTDVSNPDATLDSIANSVKDLLVATRLDTNYIDAIGFGIPGLVDAEKGIGIASVNLGWKNVAMRAGLEARLGIHCVIDNDVRVGAIGEARFGSGKGFKNLVYLNIGIGISAVIILDGNIFIGTHGLAGEIGHAVLIQEGPEGKCGGRGCFEAVASGPGIAERALGKIKNGQASILASQGWSPSLALTAEDVFSASLLGDFVAIETLEEIVQLMAYALQYLALAYDPEAIIIGGSVVLYSPFLFKRIMETLGTLSNNSWVFGKAYRNDLVRLSTLGNNAGVLGAAALVAPRL